MYKKKRKLKKALKQAKNFQKAKERKKTKKLVEAEKLRRLNFKRPLQPPSCHLLALPTEIRLMIWEYLCTLPLPVSMSRIGFNDSPYKYYLKHRNRFNDCPHMYYLKHRNRFLHSYRPILHIFNLARTCYAMYMDVTSVFVDRNLLRPRRSYKLRAPDYPLRLSRITRISTTVSEPEHVDIPSMTEDLVWKPLCRAANLVESVYPALVEFCVEVNLQPHAAIAYRYSAQYGSWAAWPEPWYDWHELLERRGHESKAERVERMKRWFEHKERYAKRPLSRKLKDVFQGCCEFMDPEGFQTALEAYCDERDERERRAREEDLR